MARSSEIPDCIRVIEPEYMTVPLRVYSKEGEFLPDSEAMDQLRNDFLLLLDSTQGGESISPKIFLLDFSGITVLDYKSARVGFTFPLEYFRGRRKNHQKELYATYINLSTNFTKFTSPWQTLQHVLEADHVLKPVVLARQEGQNDYSLIGNARKIAESKKVWVELTKESGWVNGYGFVSSRFNLNKLDLPHMHFLHMLHREGLALHAVHKETSYFRSIV